MIEEWKQHKVIYDSNGYSLKATFSCHGDAWYFVALDLPDTVHRLPHGNVEDALNRLADFLYGAAISLGAVELRLNDQTRGALIKGKTISFGSVRDEQ